MQAVQSERTVPLFCTHHRKTMVLKNNFFSPSPLKNPKGPERVSHPGPVFMKKIKQIICRKQERYGKREKSLDIKHIQAQSNGARGGTWTPMKLPSLEPESSASANSATLAYSLFTAPLEYHISYAMSRVFIPKSLDQFILIGIRGEKSACIPFSSAGGNASWKAKVPWKGLRTKHRKRLQWKSGCDKIWKLLIGWYTLSSPLPKHTGL